MTIWDLLGILSDLPKVVEFWKLFRKNPRQALLSCLVAILVTAAILACILLSRVPSTPGR